MAGRRLLEAGLAPEGSAHLSLEPANAAAPTFQPGAAGSQFNLGRFRVFGNGSTSNKLPLTSGSCGVGQDCGEGSLFCWGKGSPDPIGNRLVGAEGCRWTCR